MVHRIGVIGGDGIGPEVVAEGLKVIAAAGVDLETVDYDLGGARYERDGTILPDELLDPNSGFPSHPQSGLNSVYDTNYLDLLNDPARVLHPRDRGYVVNPGDLFLGQGNGSSMLPFPVNRDIPGDEYLYYTWRDTSLWEPRLVQMGQNESNFDKYLDI